MSQSVNVLVNGEVKRLSAEADVTCQALLEHALDDAGKLSEADVFGLFRPADEASTAGRWLDNRTLLSDNLVGDVVLEVRRKLRLLYVSVPGDPNRVSLIVDDTAPVESVVLDVADVVTLERGLHPRVLLEDSTRYALVENPQDSLRENGYIGLFVVGLAVAKASERGQYPGLVVGDHLLNLYVKVDNREGFVQKKRPHGMRTWQKRYVKIAGPCFQYLQSKGGKVCGQLMFKSVVGSSVPDQNVRLFTVSTGRRVYEFNAENSVQAKRWVTAFTRAQLMFNENDSVWNYQSVEHMDVEFSDSEDMDAAELIAASRAEPAATSAEVDEQSPSGSEADSIVSGAGGTKGAEEAGRELEPIAEVAVGSVVADKPPVVGAQTTGGGVEATPLKPKEKAPSVGLVRATEKSSGSSSGPTPAKPTEKAPTVSPAKPTAPAPSKPGYVAPAKPPGPAPSLKLAAEVSGGSRAGFAGVDATIPDGDRAVEVPATFAAVAADVTPPTDGVTLRSDLFVGGALQISEASEVSSDVSDSDLSSVQSSLSSASPLSPHAASVFPARRPSSALSKVHSATSLHFYSSFDASKALAKSVCDLNPGFVTLRIWNPVLSPAAGEIRSFVICIPACSSSLDVLHFAASVMGRSSLQRQRNLAVFFGPVPAVSERAPIGFFVPELAGSIGRVLGDARGDVYFLSKQQSLLIERRDGANLMQQGGCEVQVDMTRPLSASLLSILEQLRATKSPADFVGEANSFSRGTAEFVLRVLDASLPLALQGFLGTPSVRMFMIPRSGGKKAAAEAFAVLGAVGPSPEHHVESSKANKADDCTYFFASREDLLGGEFEYAVEPTGRDEWLKLAGSGSAGAGAGAGAGAAEISELEDAALFEEFAQLEKHVRKRLNSLSGSCFVSLARLVMLCPRLLDFSAEPSKNGGDSEGAASATAKGKGAYRSVVPALALFKTKDAATEYCSAVDGTSKLKRAPRPPFFDVPLSVIMNVSCTEAANDSRRGSEIVVQTPLMSVKLHAKSEEVQSGRRESEHRIHLIYSRLARWTRACKWPVAGLDRLRVVLRAWQTYFENVRGLTSRESVSDAGVLTVSAKMMSDSSEVKVRLQKELDGRSAVGEILDALDVTASPNEYVIVTLPAEGRPQGSVLRARESLTKQGIVEDMLLQLRPATRSVCLRSVNKERVEQIREDETVADILRELWNKHGDTCVYHLDTIIRGDLCVLDIQKTLWDQGLLGQVQLIFAKHHLQCPMSIQPKNRIHPDNAVQGFELSSFDQSFYFVLARISAIEGSLLMAQTRALEVVDEGGDEVDDDNDGAAREKRMWQVTYCVLLRDVVTLYESRKVARAAQQKEDSKKDGAGRPRASSSGPGGGGGLQRRMSFFGLEGGDVEPIAKFSVRSIRSITVFSTSSGEAPAQPGRPGRLLFRVELRSAGGTGPANVVIGAVHARDLLKGRGSPDNSKHYLFAAPTASDRDAWIHSLCEARRVYTPEGVSEEEAAELAKFEVPVGGGDFSGSFVSGRSTASRVVTPGNRGELKKIKEKEIEMAKRKMKAVTAPWQAGSYIELDPEEEQADQVEGDGRAKEVDLTEDAGGPIDFGVNASYSKVLPLAPGEGEAVLPSPYYEELFLFSKRSRALVAQACLAEFFSAPRAEHLGLFMLPWSGCPTGRWLLADDVLGNMGQEASIEVELAYRFRRLAVELPGREPLSVQIDVSCALRDIVAACVESLGAAGCTSLDVLCEGEFEFLESAVTLQEMGIEGHPTVIVARISNAEVQQRVADDPNERQIFVALPSVSGSQFVIGVPRYVKEGALSLVLRGGETDAESCWGVLKRDLVTFARLDARDSILLSIPVQIITSVALTRDVEGGSCEFRIQTPLCSFTVTAKSHEDAQSWVHILCDTMRVFGSGNFRWMKKRQELSFDSAMFELGQAEAFDAPSSRLSIGTLTDSGLDSRRLSLQGLSTEAALALRRKATLVAEPSSPAQAAGKRRNTTVVLKVFSPDLKRTKLVRVRWTSSIAETLALAVERMGVSDQAQFGLFEPASSESVHGRWLPRSSTLEELGNLEDGDMIELRYRHRMMRLRMQSGCDVRMMVDDALPVADLIPYILKKIDPANCLSLASCVELGVDFLTTSSTLAHEGFVGDCRFVLAVIPANADDATIAKNAYMSVKLPGGPALYALGAELRVHAGWLFKRRPHGLKTWQKRFFRLRRDMLSYYLGPEDREAAGEIPVATVKTVVVSGRDVKKDSPGCSFVIESRKRTFYLSTTKPDDVQGWIDVLSKAVACFNAAPNIWGPEGVQRCQEGEMEPTEEFAGAVTLAVLSSAGLGEDALKAAAARMPKRKPARSGQSTFIARGAADKEAVPDESGFDFLFGGAKRPALLKVLHVDRKMEKTVSVDLLWTGETLVSKLVAHFPVSGTVPLSQSHCVFVQAPLLHEFGRVVRKDETLREVGLKENAKIELRKRMRAVHLAVPLAEPAGPAAAITAEAATDSQSMRFKESVVQVDEMLTVGELVGVLLSGSSGADIAFDPNAVSLEMVQLLVPGTSLRCQSYTGDVTVGLVWDEVVNEKNYCVGNRSYSMFVMVPRVTGRLQRRSTAANIWGPFRYREMMHDRLVAYADQSKDAPLDHINMRMVKSVKLADKLAGYTKKELASSMALAMSSGEMVYLRATTSRECEMLVERLERGRRMFVSQMDTRDYSLPLFLPMGQGEEDDADGMMSDDDLYESSDEESDVELASVEGEDVASSASSRKEVGSTVGTEDEEKVGESALADRLPKAGKTVKGRDSTYWQQRLLTHYGYDMATVRTVEGSVLRHFSRMLDSAALASETVGLADRRKKRMLEKREREAVQQALSRSPTDVDDLVFEDPLLKQESEESRKRMLDARRATMDLRLVVKQKELEERQREIEIQLKRQAEEEMARTTAMAADDELADAMEVLDEPMAPSDRGVPDKVARLLGLAAKGGHEEAAGGDEHEKKAGADVAAPAAAAAGGGGSGGGGGADGAGDVPLAEDVAHELTPEELKSQEKKEKEDREEAELRAILEQEEAARRKRKEEQLALAAKVKERLRPQFDGESMKRCQVSIAVVGSALISALSLGYGEEGLDRDVFADDEQRKPATDLWIWEAVN